MRIITFFISFRGKSESHDELYALSFPTRVSYIIIMRIFAFKLLSNTIDYY
jgi:hypothetical protein